MSDLLQAAAPDELWPDNIMPLLGCTRRQAVSVIAVAGGHSFGGSAQRNPVTRAQLALWMKADLSRQFVQLPRTRDRWQKHVYFIACRSAIKIGYTSNIEQRLTHMRLLSPTPVHLVALMKGSQQLEAALHARFSEFRIHGEWFRRTGRLKRLLRNAPPLEETP